eukprot:5365636-Ditylum_brightwellii.AAC.2
MYKLCTVPYNTNSPTCNLAVPFYDTGSVEEWLKFWQNLQAVITRQNITDTQEGVNRPQSEPNYKKTMQDMHMHMFLLQAYVTQTWYIWRALIKPYKMSLQTFAARIHKINDQIEQFLTRDNMTPQVKLADDKLMDIMENKIPKLWQADMCRQCFDCAAEGQAKFIRFYENLELLDPPKQQVQKGRFQFVSNWQ